MGAETAGRAPPPPTVLLGEPRTAASLLLPREAKASGEGRQAAVGVRFPAGQPLLTPPAAGPGVSPQPSAGPAPAAAGRSEGGFARLRAGAVAPRHRRALPPPHAAGPAAAGRLAGAVQPSAGTAAAWALVAAAGSPRRRAPPPQRFSWSGCGQDLPRQEPGPLPRGPRALSLSAGLCCARRS